MECEVERSTKETLSTDEQKEITLSLDHYNTAGEIIFDTMGYVAI